MYRNKNIKKTYYLKDEKIEDRYTFDKILWIDSLIFYNFYLNFFINLNINYLFSW